LILLFVSYSLISSNFYLFYFPGAAAEPLGLRGAQVGNLWSKRITGTLHEQLCTYIYRWILLRMRNGSDRSCTESQKKCFYSVTFFPNIVPFIR